MKIVITEEQLDRLVKRKVGRPRKSLPDNAGINPQSSDSEKRGRGRPRKPLPVTTNPENINLGKKGRGRPRKINNTTILGGSRDRYVPEWSYEQNLIAYYCNRFGPSKLNIGPRYDEEEQLSKIANYYIGTVTVSLKMQMSNFEYLKTQNDISPIGLSDYSVKQEMIHHKYENTTEPEVRQDVLNYIDTLNPEQIFGVFIKKHNERKFEKNRESSNKKLELLKKQQSQKEYQQLKMKGLDINRGKFIGNSKINLIKYIKDGRLSEKFAVLFEGNKMRVFKTEPTKDNTMFNGKLFGNAPDTKSPNYGFLTGQEILDMISNDPIETYLDHGLYESSRKIIRLNESQLRSVIKRIIGEIGIS
jgi:hypothetical protein